MKLNNLHKINIKGDGTYRYKSRIYVIAEACAYCKESFLKVRCKKGNIYCSVTCLSRATKNKEVMDKVRSHRVYNMKGKNNPMYGKFGKDSPAWKGEKLSIAYRERHRIFRGYNEWKKAVKERDNFTCQCCGKRGGNMASHHKESFNNCPELRTELSNGITMCVKCHNDFHHQFGKGYNTSIQLNEFIKTKGVTL